MGSKVGYKVICTQHHATIYVKIVSYNMLYSKISYERVIAYNP